MNIIRANHWGMCFGVRDALTLARTAAATGPLTVLGELVHNPLVLNELRQHGTQFESQLENVRTPTVMITAHGASLRRLAEVRDRGFQVIEATCPLVHVAHRALAGLVSQGHHPVVIGQRGHVEVKGLTEDYPESDIILTEDDIRQLKPRPSFGVVAQTTQPVTRVRALVASLERIMPDARIHFRDTVCQPTRQRQEAVDDLARQCSVVIVVGGRKSNNTRELAETAGKFCDRVHQVESVDDLQSDWFHHDDAVGLTAGTSTPENVFFKVEEWLHALAGDFESSSVWSSASRDSAVLADVGMG